jgi:hypothetical protein
MSTGNATSVPTVRTAPATTTATGQSAPAANNVHHGTPKSSSRMTASVAPKRSTRRDERRTGRAGTASVAAMDRE